MLFVDTNIWLDFYRLRQSDVALKFLRHLWAISGDIIVTHQLQMEFKKNRQGVILRGLKALAGPAQAGPLGIFAEAAATKANHKDINKVDARYSKLQDRLRKVLTEPTKNDPVYKAFQRIYRRKSDLALRANDKRCLAIRRRALRRFLQGCPPRKDSDLSIGDSYNWEWMLACAMEHNADLVILTRDSDYGCVDCDRVLLNDYLKQEFGERVNKKRKIYVCKLMRDALTHFGVVLTKAEKKVEVVVDRSNNVATLIGTVSGPSSNTQMGPLTDSNAVAAFLDSGGYGRLFNVMASNQANTPIVLLTNTASSTN